MNKRPQGLALHARVNLKKRPEKVGGFLRAISKRSHEKTNRRLGPRGERAMWAAVAMDDFPMEGSASWVGRLLRLMVGVVLLPFCWVTSWAFLKQFSRATIEQGFWQSAQFWYFAVGVMVMLGWFWSKIGQSLFLYLYVFGHEMTHAVVVKCFGGRVLDMAWSSEGGYVTTDKTNWVISLSPYFVPFWSLIAVIVYVVTSLFAEVSPIGNLAFYGVIGATWGFHLAWTLWMIPRDQPDLQDNGTFLSLVLIYLGNLMVLVVLLCVASEAPLASLRDFGYSWFAVAVTWGEIALDWSREALQRAMAR